MILRVRSIKYGCYTCVMVLSREQVRGRIKEDDLISGFIDLEKQLTPQGFDLTVQKIEKYKDSGKIDFSNKEREISETEKVETVKEDSQDEYGWWDLEKGVYKVTMNEKVDIPNDLTATAYPRSSLLRMGCTIDNAVWDSGYKGTGSFMLTVQNSEGVSIKENARVNQLIFHKLEDSTKEGYSGRYHEA